MTIFQIIAILISLAAVGGYINYRFLKLPATIGHMAIALVFSLIVIGCGKMGWFDVDIVRYLVASIDFSDVVLHGMLSFLLFAGALHINLGDLKTVRVPVAILATVGVVLATFIIGSLTWWLATLVGVNLPYIYALLFGALISPTDPIAVLSILKQVGVSKKLYMKIGGESLFNDGVGVVIFLSILGLATAGEGFEVGEFARSFLHEAAGGLVLGVALGWGTYYLLKSIDDYKTEALLTLGLVAGGTVLAEHLHVSAPLCMVAAGLIVGNQGRNLGMSDKTRDNVDVFWEMLDDILNNILFMLIGLEMIIIVFTGQTVLLGVMVIGAVLFGRLVSVAVPVTLMRFGQNFERGSIRLLTWGGLRGGLSIAMALSIPESPQKSTIITLTYVVVLFSILVQGLTFKPLLKYLKV